MFWFVVKFMLMVLASMWFSNRCFDLLSRPSDLAVGSGVVGLIIVAWIWVRYIGYMVSWIRRYIASHRPPQEKDKIG